MADLPASGPIPPDGELDRRVTALETDMREVKAGVGRLEVSFARMDERMTSLTDRVSALETSVDQLRASTEASIERLRASTDASMEKLRASTDASMEKLRASTDASMEKLRASTDASMDKLRASMDASTNDLRGSIDRMRAVLDSRMVSGWQMFGIFSGLMATFFAMGGAAVAIARYAGLIH